MNAVYYFAIWGAFIAIVCLIVGLIKPRIFNKVLGKYTNRKIIALTTVGAFLVLVTISGMTEPASVKQARIDKVNVKKIAQQKKLEEQANTKDKEQPTTPEPQAAPAVTTNPRDYWHQVTAVVDGDTVKARVDGKEETIRIIGIDAPESTNSTECYGFEASAKAKELLSNKWIQLEADSTQSNRDKYDRLLRYVWLPNNVDFAKTMISEGYAYEYTYSNAYKYQTVYKENQTSAKNGSKGLWSTTTCDGLRVKPQTQTSNQSTTPTSQTVAPTTNNSSSVYYTNCDAARAAGAAPIYAGQPGYRTQLDRDKDGIACE